MTSDRIATEDYVAPVLAGPNSWLLMELTSPQVLPLKDVSVADDPLNLDTVWDQGGTKVTWSVDSPTHVNVLAGWHTAYFTAFFTFTQPSDAAEATVYPWIALIRPDLALSTWNEINPGGINRVARGSAPDFFGTFGSWPLFLVKEDQTPAAIRFGMSVYNVTDTVTCTFAECVVIRTSQ